MPIKLTYEFVKEQFEKEGYTLLSTNYINNSTKLKYRCLEGHEHFITWNNWKTGYRCPYCSGKARLSYTFIRTSFECEGYVLLSKKYKNNIQKLKYRCANGHTHYITWSDWQQGHRCPYCSGRPIITFSKVVFSFENEGYTLLTTKYINAFSTLDYLCPYGHRGTIRWANWQQGRRCPTCANINKLASGNPNWRGGKTFEKYCAVWKDKEYKSDIRDRDGNCCLNPYCDSKDPNDLTIHHINYDKKDCHPKNLVTICRSCNARANTNRSWHTAWYQAVLTKRYSYSYGEYYENSN